MKRFHAQPILDGMGDRISRYGIAALCGVVVLGIAGFMVATESWAWLVVDAVVATALLAYGVRRNAKSVPIS